MEKVSYVEVVTLSLFNNPSGCASSIVLQKKKKKKKILTLKQAMFKRQVTIWIFYEIIRNKFIFISRKQNFAIKKNKKKKKKKKTFNYKKWKL